MTAIVALLLAAPQGNVILDDSLTPPYSSSTADLVPGVAVTVDHDGLVRVDSRKVGRLRDPGFAAALSQALTRRYDTITFISIRGGAPYNGVLLLVADRDTPFGDISTIVATAYATHFPKVRFVTLAM